MAPKAAAGRARVLVGRANKKRRCAGADASASSGFWGHLGGFLGFL